MKKLLTLTLTLLMLLSLTACGEDEEPPAPSDDTATLSRFGDANQDQERYFKSIIINGTVYGNNYYFISNSCTIKTVPLPSGGETFERTQSTAVCSDTLCTHDYQLDCPAYLRHPEAIFLLDAAESNGENPVFYYSRCTGDYFDSHAWQSGQTWELVRYDSAQGKAESIASVNYPIDHFMTYGEYVYFIAQTGADRNVLFRVSKKGER